MKGVVLPIGGGLVLALLALGLVVALRPSAATPGARADALAAELRCPDCQGLAVADSSSPSAREIRRQIVALVDGGATDDQVRSHFVARYGEWILLAPTAPVAWVLPFATVVMAGAILLVRLMRRRVTPRSATRLGDDERRRLHEEAEALDA